MAADEQPGPVVFCHPAEETRAREAAPPEVIVIALKWLPRCHFVFERIDHARVDEMITALRESHPDGLTSEIRMVADDE